MFLKRCIVNVSANSRELVESDDDLLDAELRKSISSTIYATLCQVDIYTLSTQYLHNIYTLSTHYLHIVSGGQQQQHTRADEEELEQRQDGETRI